MSQVTLKHLLAKLDVNELLFQWLGSSCAGATANKKGDEITYKLVTQVPIFDVLMGKTKDAIVLWVDKPEVKRIIAELEANKHLQEFTVFCRQKDGKGTTWIGAVHAKDVDEAAELGVQECAEAWNYPEGDVHVCGVAEGDVKILNWDDPEV